MNDKFCAEDENGEEEETSFWRGINPTDDARWRCVFCVFNSVASSMMMMMMMMMRLKKEVRRTLEENLHGD